MRDWKMTALFLIAAVLSCTQQLTNAAPFLVNKHATRIPRQQPTKQYGSDEPFMDHRIIPRETNGNALSMPYPRADPPSFLTGVILVSAGNMLFNWMRPDPAIAWETRVPRILWEFFLLCSAATLRGSSPDGAGQLSYLLMSLMLGTTALIDIFFWAPVFGLWAGMDNKDCSGGWFTGRPYVCKPNPVKGYGRLLVTLQCLYAGAFYLNCAIASWGEYSAQRDYAKAERQAQLFERYLHHHGG